ncbi:hypothetical protein HNR31_003428 [Anoxybacillus caldiproteolyticus]|uniref:Uncharacterized protein n=1 Tax=Thermaerobacillus caldiproteolyticus TaxID=247480 RepID=A0A7W0C0C3_9BACL|nr:hypothetical protein [Anoxybacillus caldiproteolyticus]
MMDALLNISTMPERAETFFQKSKSFTNGTWYRLAHL